jgi:hypothetical protein
MVKKISFDKNLNINIILFSHTDEYTHIYVEYNDATPLLRYIAGKEELKRVKNFMNRVNINKNT